MQTCNDPYPREGYQPDGSYLIPVFRLKTDGPQLPTKYEIVYPVASWYFIHQEPIKPRKGFNMCYYFIPNAYKDLYLEIEYHQEIHKNYDGIGSILNSPATCRYEFRHPKNQG